MNELKELYEIAGPSLFFALFVALVVEGFRRSVTKILVPVVDRYGWLKNLFWRNILGAAWNSVLLPLLIPCTLGALMAYFLPMMSYPKGVDTSAERIMFGVGVGAVSSVLYRVIKALVNSWAESRGAKEPDSNDAI